MCEVNFNEILIRSKYLIVLIAAISFSNNIYSQSEQNDSTKTNYDNLEITGMLIDKTQTKIGKEFYELFYKQWYSPEVNFDYSILFEEKASPGMGTQISITINDLMIFQQFVQPRYEKIEEMVQLALQVASSHLEYYSQILNELQFDELDGTGIY